MRSTFKIGSVAGIGIFLHWTFGALLVAIFGLYLYRGSTVGMALLGLALVMGVFVCVVLHELGHALTARRFAVATRDITIYPIGGVARLERLPAQPMEELWVALAGPAVNAVLAAGFALLAAAVGEPLAPSVVYQPDAHLLATFVWFNAALAVFNLLPAFPMDGGRVLRALLAMRMSLLRATRIAVAVGTAMAALFAVVGFFEDPILLFIALFVYLGAQQELDQIRAAAEHARAQEAGAHDGAVPEEAVPGLDRPGAASLQDERDE